MLESGSPGEASKHSTQQAAACTALLHLLTLLALHTYMLTYISTSAALLCRIKSKCINAFVMAPTGIEPLTYKLSDGDAAEHRCSHVLQGSLHALRPAPGCHQEGMHYVCTEFHGNAKSHGQVHN